MESETGLKVRMLDGKDIEGISMKSGKKDARHIAVLMDGNLKPYVVKISIECKSITDDKSASMIKKSREKMAASDPKTSYDAAILNLVKSYTNGQDNKGETISEESDRTDEAGRNSEKLRKRLEKIFNMKEVKHVEMKDLIIGGKSGRNSAKMASKRTDKLGIESEKNRKMIEKIFGIKSTKHIDIEDFVFEGKSDMNSAEIVRAVRDGEL